MTPQLSDELLAIVRAFLRYSLVETNGYYNQLTKSEREICTREQFAKIYVWTMGEWSGSLDPADPDNYWIDDATGERVNAQDRREDKS